MTNVTMLAHNRLVLTKQALNTIGSGEFNITIRTDAEMIASLVFEWNDQNARRDTFGYMAHSLGTGQARNCVIGESENHFGRGEYLYLSDNDVFFHPNWLPQLIERYEYAWKYGFRVLGAYNHPYHQPVAYLPIPFMGEVKEVMALALQSMLMRWSVWDKYGPFCETPVGQVCQGEDVDFTNKIRADGYKLGVVDPPLLVNTGITNSFGEKIPGWELVKAQCPEGILCE